MFKEVGLFGALGTDCDSPFPLVQTTFEFLQKQVQDIDFIIYTGDTVRHVSFDLVCTVDISLKRPYYFP
jgi:hypothetical protein